MGVDLTLMPLTADHPGFPLAHSMLLVERRRTLWDAVEAVPSKPAEAPVSCFRGDDVNGKEGYGTRTKDCYGDALRLCRAGDLAALADHDGVTSAPMNVAIWAFLKALPPDHRIALYWH
jgi:hypothetical protein